MLTIKSQMIVFAGVLSIGCFGSDRIQAAGGGWAQHGVSETSSLLLTVRDEHRDHHEHYEFHHREIRLFNEYELGIWTTGLWLEGWYGGQYGWWWVSGGRRYFYDRPIYPYPPVVSDVWYPQTTIIEQSPPVIISPPPPQVVQAPPPAPMPQSSQTWYYCDSPAGYYPYVQTCMTPFRPVPAAQH